MKCNFKKSFQFHRQGMLITTATKSLFLAAVHNPLPHIIRTRLTTGNVLLRKHSYFPNQWRSCSWWRVGWFLKCNCIGGWCKWRSFGNVPNLEKNKALVVVAVATVDSALPVVIWSQTENCILHRRASVSVSVTYIFEHFINTVGIGHRQNDFPSTPFQFWTYLSP